MARSQLTDKQRVFIEHYLVHWNATEAARQAGYNGDTNTLGVIGHENLRKPKIRSAIEARINELKMDADEALTRLSAMARGASGLDLAAVFMQNSLPESLAAAHARGIDVLIKKAKKTKYGLELELYDAQSAIKTILQHLGELALGDWRELAIEKIKRGEITHDALSEALEDVDLATELFARAGVPVEAGQG